jgi:uncharacterized protein YdhG (YjbR/CyaY superfamily)
MQSKAKTVEQYIAELPPERQEQIETVRRVILENIPEGYEEVMNWGMITYQVPLEIYPNTYNKQPLMYTALSSQKNHMSVYLTGIYMDEEERAAFEDQYRATGKRYDVGQSCVRFRKLDDLPLELIGEVISRYSVEEYVQKFKEIRSTRKKQKA